MIATQKLYRVRLCLVLLAVSLVATVGVGKKSYAAANRVLPHLKRAEQADLRFAPAQFQILASMLAVAQEQEGAKKAGEAQDKPTPKTATVKEEKKKRTTPRGRLPVYYSRVVTEKQRLDIYKIQQDYNDQIAELQEQIDEFVSKRDTEVADVLSSEQLANVKRMMDEAKKRRSSAKTKSTNSSASSSTGGSQ